MVKIMIEEREGYPCVINKTTDAILVKCQNLIHAQLTEDSIKLQIEQNQASVAVTSIISLDLTGITLNDL